jgi:hypothetical protein
LQEALTRKTIERRRHAVAAHIGRLQRLLPRKLCAIDTRKSLG